MRFESNRGRGGVGLTFEVGTDMTRVMLDVVSRLNSLPPLPLHADEPRLAQTFIAARDVSAGFADVGCRQFTVRVTGRELIADLGELVVGWSDDSPLYPRDVAEIRAAHVDAVWFSYRGGVPACYITLQRTSESNTVELNGRVKEAIAELNAGPLAGEKLYLEM
jgi:multidrug efflux pump subunit AcrB